MSYKASARLILIFLLISVSADKGFCISDPIDQKLTLDMDVTGDGIAETIDLNLTGVSWTSPLQWNLRVKKKKKIILQHESDDKELDAFFSDPGYVSDCEGYMGCKRKYYETDLLEHLVVVTDLSNNKHAYDPQNTGSIYIVARKSLLDKYHVPEGRASKIIDSMVRRLKSGRTPLLYVPISPVQTAFPVMFVPEVDGFVEVYEW